MTRVKRGTTANKRRKNILGMAKGYRFGRSKKERQAREAIQHAGMDAFIGRRDKKGDFRTLWQIKINAGTRAHNISYSTFMGTLKKKGIALNRKVLATMAEHKPDAFAKLVAEVK